MIQDGRKDKEHDIKGLKRQGGELLDRAWEKGYVAGFNDGYATARKAFINTNDDDGAILASGSWD